MYYWNIRRPRDEKLSIACLEDDCTGRFKQIEDLQRHLVIKHDKEMQDEHHSFRNKSEFRIWKHLEGQKNSCIYSTRAKCLDNSQGDETWAKKYYYCSRIIRKFRGRKLKSHSPFRIDGRCTSTIELIKTAAGFDVHYVKTHYGHTVCSVENTPEKFFDNIRQSIDNKFELINFLSKQDLKSIGNAIYTSAQNRTTAAISINNFVETLKKTENNAIIIYKPLGVTLIEYPEINSDSFVLGVMTNLQCSYLLNFGNNGIVCMDSIHESNDCALKFISLMVVNEYDVAFPFAFFFSNKDNNIHLRYFITAIKNKAGLINCRVLMTNYDKYFNIWTSIMSSDGIPRKLLCTWYVDRKWRSKLVSIQDMEKRKCIYTTMCILREQIDLVKFNNSFSATIDNLRNDKDARTFVHYLENEFVYKYAEWAQCYRQDFGIYANTYLEAMHNTVKQIYMKGSEISLDKSLQILLKIVEDKQHEFFLYMISKSILNFPEINKSSSRPKRSSPTLESQISECSSSKIARIEHYDMTEENRPEISKLSESHLHKIAEIQSISNSAQNNEISECSASKIAGMEHLDTKEENRTEVEETAETDSSYKTAKKSLGLEVNTPETTSKVSEFFSILETESAEKNTKTLENMTPECTFDNHPVDVVVKKDGRYKVTDINMAPRCASRSENSSKNNNEPKILTPEEKKSVSENISPIMSEINQLHERAMRPKGKAYVSKENDDFWCVRLLSDTYRKYKISRTTVSSNHKCKKQCSSCGACFHKYICFCSDYYSSQIGCTHIHLIAMNQKHEPIEQHANMAEIELSSTSTSESEDEESNDDDLEEEEAEERLEEEGISYELYHRPSKSTLESQSENSGDNDESTLETEIKLENTLKTEDEQESQSKKWEHIDKSTSKSEIKVENTLNSEVKLERQCENREVCDESTSENSLIIKAELEKQPENREDRDSKEEGNMVDVYYMRLSKSEQTDLKVENTRESELKQERQSESRENDLDEGLEDEGNMVEEYYLRPAQSEQTDLKVENTRESEVKQESQSESRENDLDEGLEEEGNMVDEYYLRPAQSEQVESENKIKEDTLECGIKQESMPEDSGKERKRASNYSGHYSFLNWRHDSAAEWMKPELITKVSDTCWTMRSAQDASIQYKISMKYFIHKALNDQINSCPSECPKCGACACVYKCNCPDYKSEPKACKHIHLVHMHKDSLNDENTSGNEAKKEEIEYTDGETEKEMRNEAIVHVNDTDDENDLENVEPPEQNKPSTSKDKVNIQTNIKEEETSEESDSENTLMLEEGNVEPPEQNKPSTSKDKVNIQININEEETSEESDSENTLELEDNQDDDLEEEEDVFYNNFSFYESMFARPNKSDKTNMRHDSAITAMGPDFVTKVSDRRWLVHSATYRYLEYRVIANGKHKCNSVKCYKCGVCVHEYICSCPDYQKNKIICKHIHLVATYGIEEEEDDDDEDDELGNA